MKKRKVYEISVIDKTYSKTISDETKFYTSDTALELVFKLKEIEYTFESAEIVLLNIDDRSLVTRPVAKNLDSFVYELDDDITAHYGEWHGQLRFEQSGETYVSSPVKFRIENDLSNDRPPQLSDVQSWVSLKRYADELTEELKQAVLSIEGVEDTFNTNETARQTTFETNENERDSTFNTNEDIRQTQESEREEAESARQQAESQRQSTFETNETERQTNFETAEQVRQSAELIRIENENQRKIDHENRSAEFDGKADKKQEDWISPSLVNGALGTVQYRKNQMGRVEFRGRLAMGNQTYAFILPSGYRPNDFTLIFLPEIPTGISTRVISVSKEGLFYFYKSSKNEVSLDSFSYPV